jgi:hypothetical protein
VSKLKKTPPTLPPQEWVDLKDAFSRIIGPCDAALSSLNRDLRSGRLGSALLEISPDEKVRMRPLKSSDWKHRTVYAQIDQKAIQVQVQPYAAAVYFVRRADLDKFYPIPGTPAPTLAPQTDDAPNPGRRKPGPKIKNDWRLHVAAETHRIREKEKRIPSAAELAQFCENNLGYQPDESAIQKLLRYLRGD